MMVAEVSRRVDILYLETQSKTEPSKLAYVTFKDLQGAETPVLLLCKSNRALFFSPSSSLLCFAFLGNAVRFQYLKSRILHRFENPTICIDSKIQLYTSILAKPRFQNLQSYDIVEKMGGQYV